MADSSQKPQTSPTPDAPHASGGGPPGRSHWVVIFLLDRLLPAAVWGAVAAGGFVQLIKLWPSLQFLDRCRRGTIPIFFLLAALLFLVRHARRGPRARWWERAVALAATFGLPAVPLTFGWITPRTIPPWLTLTSIVLSWTGMIWTIVSLAYLGRCFGVFPEPRGLVTKGPYRWIRHPIYLGEMVGATGVVLGMCNWIGAFPLAVFIALQTWRAINEERALLAQFPDYRSYMRRTWGLLPAIW